MANGQQHRQPSAQSAEQGKFPVDIMSIICFNSQHPGHHIARDFPGPPGVKNSFPEKQSPLPVATTKPKPKLKSLEFGGQLIGKHLEAGA